MNAPAIPGWPGWPGPPWPVRGRAALAAAAALVTALLVSTEPAAGQPWSMEIRGGELRYQGGPGLETSRALAGLRYRSPDASLLLSAGIPLSGEDPVWAAVAGSRRLSTETGPVVLGVDLAADGFAQRDRSSRRVDDALPGWEILPGRPIPEEPLNGWGVAGRAMPFLALEGPYAGLEIGAGGAAYRSEFAGARLDRDVLEVKARTTLTPSPNVLLAATARRVAADEGDYDRVDISGALVRGHALVRGSVGRWLVDEIDALHWSTGVSVEVAERVEVSLTARKHIFDPLYLTPERTSWGVGMSVRLGRSPRLAPPVPASYQDGLATVVLDEGEGTARIEGGAAPRIAGDFTDWKPVPMERAAEGWRFTTPLEPGVYRYAFVTAAGDWFVPESHPGRRPDDFGGWVAVLVVEASSEASS